MQAAAEKVFPPFSSGYLLPASISRLPRIGAAREVVHASLGCEQSKQALNFGLHTVCRREADRSTWRSVMETAMLLDGRATP